MADPVTIPVEDDGFESRGQPSFQEFGAYHGAEFDVSGNIGADRLGTGDDDGYEFETEKSRFLKGADGERDGESREEDRSASGGGFFACLSVEYYQKFFDVSTMEVLSRILWAVVPHKRPFSAVTQERPDFYGPFWVCMTLVFTLSVCHHLGLTAKSKDWALEFDQVVLVCCVVYVYAWVVAALVWGFFWWRAGTFTFSFLHTLCMYGYSLSGYNLFFFLLFVPVNWLSWLLVALIASVTGLVLVYPFWMLLKEKQDKKMAFILVALFLCHAGVGAALKLLTLQRGLLGSTAAGPLPTSNSTGMGSTEAGQHPTSNSSSHTYSTYSI